MEVNVAKFLKTCQSQDILKTQHEDMVSKETPHGFYGNITKYHFIQKHIQPIACSSPRRARTKTNKTKSLRVTCKIKTTARPSTSTKDDEWNPSPRRRSTNNRNPPQTKSRRRLITISTSADGKWNDTWTSDYVFSLAELRLGDLAEDGHKDAEVFISLTIEKHASFGFSVHGRIMASFNSKCISCSCSYCREINTTFDVWVLPSSDDRSAHLPDIGGDDPSVIYVKPGCEADLDSLIQDTIRLTTSVKETCSEICEKSEQRWQCISNPKEVTAVDGRWSALLKLKKKAI